MRYFAYLAGKFVIAGVALYGLLRLIDNFWPAEDSPSALAPLQNAPQMLTYYFAVLLWFLLCAGALALIVLDQRRRCRVCLRRLRMPVTRGSRGRMLLIGRPSLEYICPYGHGTLTSDESHLTGVVPPVWQTSPGFWEDLVEASASERGRG